MAFIKVTRLDSGVIKNTPEYETIINTEMITSIKKHDFRGLSFYIVSFGRAEIHCRKTEAQKIFDAIGISLD